MLAKKTPFIMKRLVLCLLLHCIWWVFCVHTMFHKSPLMSVAEYGGWTKLRQRNTLWPVSLAYGRVRVMGWFGVWMGHTQDLCLFYPRISIECAKCWTANNNPSLILGNPMQSSEGPTQGSGTGGQQVAEGDLALCANIMPMWAAWITLCC